MQKNPSIQELLDVMTRLRDKQTGCPWDVEQNFASIAPYTLEEAYEVAEAIAHNDMQALREELGDLLLQVVFHSQMAKESQFFDFYDVVETIREKLIRRHPHVFGDKQVTDADASLEAWEAIKAEERKAKSNGADKPHGLLDNIPYALPALTRALKIQNRAAKVGFDWKDVAPIFAKMTEEIGELQQALDENAPQEELAGELGDILFVCVNLARRLQVDPEEALRMTNRKFESRFRYIEERLHATGRSTDDATLEEMDALWDEAKRKERAA